MSARTQFRLLTKLLSILAISACNRTEEPHSSGDAQAAPPVPAAPVAPEKSTGETQNDNPPKAACIVPLPAEPLPRAPKALHCPVDPSGPPELARGYVVFGEAPGSPRVNVELARSVRTLSRRDVCRSKFEKFAKTGSAICR